MTLHCFLLLLQTLARDSSGNEYNSKYSSAIHEKNGLTEDNKMSEENNTTELIQLIKDIGRKLDLLEIKHSVSENTPLDTCTATTDAKEMHTNNGKYFCV